MDIEKLLLNKGIAAMLPPKEEVKKGRTIFFRRLIGILNYEIDIMFHLFIKRRR